MYVVIDISQPVMVGSFDDTDQCFKAGPRSRGESLIENLSAIFLRRSWKRCEVSDLIDAGRLR